MTFNEKRAHDIAVSSMAAIINPAYARNLDPDIDGKIEVDPYQKYKIAYDSALRALNRDYPDGNR